ncbi:hypothetical protein HFO56_33855 [Rhizobium laguerreae]|uniref:hypothetical protein n=1 Tax=Rhizobium laguerreae TaxID=1076926 RepID=UPI001C91A66E|nr:hypothetical protein [Rhizobium laguerreae]MBY3157313.1 hypothetical protein [Rhizobium laguerreae]
MDRRSKIPPLLTAFRGLLGDAGIPHRLRRTKNGWPYVKFEAPSVGQEVSLQYRNKHTNKETKEVRDAHYLVFIRLQGEFRQATRSFADAGQLLAFLGIDAEMLAKNRDGRESLSAHERAVSVMTHEVEQSYTTLMRCPLHGSARPFS